MEWDYILGIIIETLILDTAGGILFYIAAFEDWCACIPMPSDFKFETNMNWFGSIICYIVLFIIFPILNIGKVIYWLSHI